MFTFMKKKVFFSIKIVRIKTIALMGDSVSQIKLQLSIKR